MLHIEAPALNEFSFLQFLMFVFHSFEDTMFQLTLPVAVFGVLQSFIDQIRQF
jgi:hypothetical protein